jgi:hypothetical protein
MELCWIVLWLQTFHVTGLLPLAKIGENRDLHHSISTLTATMPEHSFLEKEEEDEPSNIHRRIVVSSLLGFTLFVPVSAVAVTKKPFAPIETLLPAARVKRTIDRALSLTNGFVARSNNNSNSDKEAILDELKELLLKPQNYVQSLQLQGVPAKPADLYLNSYKPMKGDLPLQRVLIQWGDVQTWKALKKSEKEKERSSEIRAALNAYTDALSFTSVQYLLNVDKTTRSTMVREDRLPDVKQVITSDMGVRYLYRNEVLTSMDDVKAELEYQVTTSTTTSSLEEQKLTDLLELLQVASNAMDRWFSLIDSKDVQDAIDAIANEKP